MTCATSFQGWPWYGGGMLGASTPASTAGSTTGGSSGISGATSAGCASLVSPGPPPLPPASSPSIPAPPEPVTPRQWRRPSVHVDDDGGGFVFLTARHPHHPDAGRRHGQRPEGQPQEHRSRTRAMRARHRYVL